MTQAGTPCPLCNSALAAKTLADVSGDEAPMRLTVKGMPVLECETSHRYFLGQKFPIWLLNAVTDGELAKIPAGRQKGLVFHKYACGECGELLASAESEAKTFSAEFAWEKTPRFTVEISVPVYRCASCGRQQARSGDELAKLLPAALVHAFMAAGLKAPG